MFDPDNLDAVFYAAECDNHAPTHWAGEFRPAPAGERYLGRHDETGEMRVTVVSPAGEPYLIPPCSGVPDRCTCGFY